MIYDFDKFTNDSSDDHPKYADGLGMKDGETFEGLSEKEITEQEQTCLELAAMFDGVEGPDAEARKNFLLAAAASGLTQEQLDELTAEVRRVFLDE